MNPCQLCVLHLPGGEQKGFSNGAVRLASDCLRDTAGEINRTKEHSNCVQRGFIK